MRFSDYGIALLPMLCMQSAWSDSLTCKVRDAFQLTEGGNLESSPSMRRIYREAFYVDSETGKITGGPMATTGWGEVQVFPVKAYRSFTVLLFTQGQGTNRGLRTLYVGERLQSGEHAFQIADGLFIYSGMCK